MLATLRKRFDREDEGFTLIELMVVVLIIAILLAIAIPTFLGAQDRARDRGAQSNLRNSLTAAKTLATDKDGLFTGVTETDLNGVEPSLTHVAGPVATTAGTKDVGVNVADGLLSGGATPASGKIVLTAKSASGKYFGICTDQRGAVKYMQGTTTAPADAAAAFTACSQDKF